MKARAPQVVRPQEGSEVHPTCDDRVGGVQLWPCAWGACRLLSLFFTVCVLLCLCLCEAGGPIL